MTLQQRIDLIDMLINENPDARIKDYLELTGELPYLDETTDVSVPELPAPPRPRIDKGMRKYYNVARIRL